MSSLTGRVAVVTGASKGIGAGIAKGMAAAGASVVVNYSSSKDGADKVVAQIEGMGGQAVAVQGDMSKPEDVKRLFAETKSAFGALDVLVNNAGVFDFQPIEAITDGRVSPAVQYECARADPDDSRSVELLPGERRERD